jgi:hypothetical protein
MKIRRLALAAVAVLLPGLAFAAPAGAADTVATFSITAGGLAVTVPSGTVALSGATAAAGSSSVAGTLGSVSVADTRGALVATWTTTFSSTAFTTGGASADETVALANISYASGTVSKTGTGTAVPNVGTAMSALAAARVVTFAGIGNNTASWNPTLTFTLLGSQVAGTYTGTVTHSVA